MIRVKQVKVSIDNIDIMGSISKKLKVNTSDIIDYKIIKESIDSRKKPEIYLVYELDVNLKDEKSILNKNILDVSVSLEEEYNFIPSGEETLHNRPIIIGSGPSGLFASYMLALNGYKPLIIERGEKIEDRVKKVNKFIESGILDINSNVQFGEGGAGTFSDGKLNTMIKDKRNIGKKVFEIFVENGAPSDIMYKNKPHIGTDILRNVIINIRNKIIKMGGEFLFSTTLTDLIIKDNTLDGIIVNNENVIKTDCLLLAIGNSARDTFTMLNKYLKLESKPFAVGIRVQHLQKDIDISQYGKSIKLLGPASYKLTYTTKEGRGVYTFCMCPGGYVINSSSLDGYLVINGMSNHLRDSLNANSAVIVTVGPKDYGNNPLDGMNYQMDLERKAFLIKNGQIPTQLYKDFKDNKMSTEFGKVKPIFQGNYEFANLNDILPKYLKDSIIEGIEYFGTKIKGFNDKDVILSGIETRTSSPVRIIRNDNFECNIKGIYPCGEGSGYAGGITSSAIDGIKASEEVMKYFKKGE